MYLSGVQGVYGREGKREERRGIRIAREESENHTASYTHSALVDVYLRDVRGETVLGHGNITGFDS